MALTTQVHAGFASLRENIQKNIQELEAKIDFNADLHSYYHTEQGHYYASVSETIEKVSHPFPRKEIATRVSEAEGVSFNEINEQWLIRRNFSSVRGQEMHLYAKVFLDEQRILKPLTPIQGEIRAFHGFYDKYFQSKKYQVLANEFIVYNEGLKIAGTVDCLLVDEDERFLLLDWKTNKKIRTQSAYHRRMLGPLDDIEECEFSRYSLQLSIYSHLIEHSLHIPIHQCYVVQLTSEARFKIFKLRDLRDRLADVFSFVQNPK